MNGILCSTQQLRELSRHTRVRMPDRNDDVHDYLIRTDLEWFMENAHKHIQFPCQSFRPSASTNFVLPSRQNGQSKRPEQTKLVDNDDSMQRIEFRAILRLDQTAAISSGSQFFESFQLQKIVQMQLRRSSSKVLGPSTHDLLNRVPSVAVQNLQASNLSSAQIDRTGRQKVLDLSALRARSKFHSNRRIQLYSSSKRLKLIISFLLNTRLPLIVPMLQVRSAHQCIESVRELSVRDPNQFSQLVQKRIFRLSFLCSV